MRYVFDLQACQTRGSRGRGIGRYSMSLVRGIIENRREEEDVRIALNANYPDEAGLVMTELGDLLPETAFSFYRTPIIDDVSPQDRDALRRIGSQIAHHHYATLSPDIVHNGLPFTAGEGPEMTLQAPNLERCTGHAATLYDLIPLLFDDVYLADPAVRAGYLETCEALKDYDVLLAISEASRRDAIEHLGIEAGRVVAIMGAADPIFRPGPVDGDRMARLRREYGIARPYVMYTGGMDFRKNVDAAVAAFADLPSQVRSGHDLVIVCKVAAPERRHLEDLARSLGVENNLIVTGFVPDEDLVALYRGCALFCFPSLYEGFGLPVLEAMACGAPSIASDNSSLPEIVGRADATFDAADRASVTAKMLAVLTEPGFAADLRRSGLARAAALTWDASALATLDAFREVVLRRQARPSRDERKPKVAMVSPLPPQQSGIANHLQDLLPSLEETLDVAAIVDPAVPELANVDHPVHRSIDELSRIEHDIAVHQMGNSEFHLGSIATLEGSGGVLVLHDVFLSPVLHVLAARPGSDIDFDQRVASSLRPGDERQPTSWADAVERSPANRSLIEAADGLIVHSHSAASLIRSFLPGLTSPRIKVIGLACRDAEVSPDERDQARRRLGLEPEDVVGIHIGFVGPPKASLELLTAVERVCSTMPRFRFFFVGRSTDREFDALLGRSAHASRIEVTGFVDDEALVSYLQAADLAVQLRRKARGESSLAVLECMAHGVPVVVSDIGSFSELPEDTVVRTPVPVETEALAEAIEGTARSPERREALRDAARSYLIEHHSPETVANSYREAIDAFLIDREARDWKARIANLSEPISQVPERLQVVAQDLVYSSRKVAHSAGNRRFLSGSGRARRLLLDVSEVHRKDHATGVQRVVRGVTGALRDAGALNAGPFESVPVALHEGRIGVPTRFVDRPSEDAGQLATLQWGDDLLMLDSSWRRYNEFAPLFRMIRERGGRIFTAVYDLVPLLHPDAVDAHVLSVFERWLQQAALVSDGLVCISQAVADEVIAHVETHDWPHRDGLKIGWWHLGSDLPPRLDHERVRDEIETVLAAGAADAKTFLMVGTIEPRKRHGVVLDAMERLWADGSDARLLLLGKEGWRVEELARRIRKHSQLGRRLFWFTDVKDAEIALAYKRTDALVFASIYEGYGLPVVEAARAGLGAIVSDIPVLREVGGEGVAYFPPDDAEALADTLRAFERGQVHTDPGRVKVLSWAESGEQLLDVIYGGRWHATLRS